jgi:4-carboxymuconolactone decarboxylase
MSQQIHLAAIVMRDGRLLMYRQRPDSGWELPGGQLTEDHADTDFGMDAILTELGINAPAIEEDFVETVYLPGENGHIVYNIYAPSDWVGEPSTPPGVGVGWFALEELESVEMDRAVRNTILSAFGLKESEDPSEMIMAAVSGALSHVVDSKAKPTEPSRREAGRDVLRTLGGGNPKSEEQLRERYPELADDILDYVLGDAWQHPALDRKARSLQVVAMLSALGGKPGPLRSHINGALNHGATPEQVIETLRMVAVYAGFPAAMEAWMVMEEVFAARGLPRPKSNKP